VWLLIVPALFLLVFYAYPMAAILVEGFGRGDAGAAGALADALASPRLLRIIGFTFGQAALSTLLTLTLGLPGAYLLARVEFPGKSLFRAVTAVPFVLPTLVVAAAFNALLGPQGWINLGLMGLLGLRIPPIQFANTLTAILTAHVFYNTTIVLRLVGDFWAHLDPRLNQAAQMLGAGRVRALLRITAPLLAPAVLAAAALVFIFDFSSFGVILVLGGPKFATLETEIYTQTVGLFNLPLASALAVIQLACTLALSLVYARLSGRMARPLSLRPQTYSARRMRSLGGKMLAYGLLAGLILLTTLPLLALALRSAAVFETARGASAPVFRGFSLDYYRELTLNRRQSIFYAPPAVTAAVSLMYGLGTAGLALLLGLPAAWGLARRSADAGPGGAVWRGFDAVLMLPLGTSAVTLGLGFVIALGRPPFNLGASPLLTLFAHTLAAFPFVVRSLTPALRSVQPRVRQAAAVLGASPWTVFRRVDLPLIGRALAAAAAFAFAISMGEFGATALVSRPEYPTMPIAIYRLLGRPGELNFGQALALSTILMIVTAGAVLLIERLRLGEGSDF
jgi:thiamine transport system permease protein